MFGHAERNCWRGSQRFMDAAEIVIRHVHPKLREHVASVVMLMKYSPNWKVFMERRDREFPQWGTNFLLPFPDDYTPPDDVEAAN
jgi:hypothetical protein